MNKPYNILELDKLNMLQLLEIAANMSIATETIKGKQLLMYAILDKQEETSSNQ